MPTKSANQPKTKPEIQPDTQSANSSAPSARDFSREHVVLVHGLAANRLVMLPMAKRLREQGFQVTNYGYWSSRHKIERHSKKLQSVVSNLHEEPSIDRIHFVTHSMGCIIGRHLFAQQTFSKLGRWVMLAPPNRGSHAADFLGRFFTWMLVPLPQMSESPDSFVNTLPDFRDVNEVDFAVVEAAHDRVISRDNVPLEGQSDYAVIQCHHGTMPFNPEVVDYAHQFLTRPI